MKNLNREIETIKKIQIEIIEVKSKYIKLKIYWMCLKEVQKQQSEEKVTKK